MARPARAVRPSRRGCALFLERDRHSFTPARGDWPCDRSQASSRISPVHFHADLHRAPAPARPVDHVGHLRPGVRDHPAPARRLHHRIHRPDDGVRDDRVAAARRRAARAVRPGPAAVGAVLALDEARAPRRVRDGARVGQAGLGGDRRSAVARPWRSRSAPSSSRGCSRCRSGSTPRCASTPSAITSRPSSASSASPCRAS